MYQEKKAEKYLPAPVRNTISFEAGVNDGLAFPLVVIGLMLVNSGEVQWMEWLYDDLLYKSVAAALIAFGVGYLGGVLMHKAHKKGFMDTKALLPFSIGLSFLLLGGINYLGMNGIIAVFAGGVGFTQHIEKNEDLKEERVQEAMERIFTIPAFFLFGLMLPINKWSEYGWGAVVFCLLILFFR